MKRSEAFMRCISCGVNISCQQDLISAAFNESVKKVDDMMASEMQKMTAGLGLPPGLF